MEHWIATEPMNGKWASSRVDLGYKEIFCFPELTSVFISSCDSVLGDSLVFRQANQGCLHVLLGLQHCSAQMQGNRALSPGEEDAYEISQVAAGTWGIFLSYSTDGHSKPDTVQ